MRRENLFNVLGNQGPFPTLGKGTRDDRKKFVVFHLLHILTRSLEG